MDVCIARHALDPTVANRKGRGDILRIAEVIRTWGAPRRALLDDHLVAPMKDSSGLEVDPRPFHPIEKEGYAMPRAARATHLDVVVDQPGKAVRVSRIERVVPGLDDGD